MSGGALQARPPEINEPVTPSSRSARASAWGAVVVLALALVAPFEGAPLLRGPAATVTAGPVEWLDDDGTWEPAPAGTELASGAQIRVRGADGVLQVPAGRITLASGTEVRVGAGTMTVDRGALLLEVDELVTVASGAVEARGRGVWRTDLTSFARVGVYRGGVAVRGGERDAVVAGRLEQVGLPDGTVAAAPEPLRYLDADPWDRRLLPEAIAVDGFVQRLGRSLTARYGDLGQSSSFYEDFAAGEEIVAAVLDRDGVLVEAPADVLTRIAVVTALSRGAPMAPREAARRTARLRRAGAQWGLVLTRHDVGLETLRDAADEALRQRETQVTEGVAAPVEGPEESVEAPSEPAPQTPPTSPPDEPQQPPPGEGEPDEEPEDEGSDLPGPDEVTDPVEDTVDDIVDDTEDTVDDVEDTVDDTVDDAEDTVDDAEDTVDDLLPDIPDPPGTGGAEDPQGRSAPRPPGSRGGPARPEGPDRSDAAGRGGPDGRREPPTGGP